MGGVGPGVPELPKVSARERLTKGPAPKIFWIEGCSSGSPVREDFSGHHWHRKLERSQMKKSRNLGGLFWLGRVFLGKKTGALCPPLGNRFFFQKAREFASTPKPPSAIPGPFTETFRANPRIYGNTPRKRWGGGGGTWAGPSRPQGRGPGPGLFFPKGEGGLSHGVCGGKRKGKPSSFGRENKPRNFSAFEGNGALVGGGGIPTQPTLGDLWSPFV